MWPLTIVVGFLIAYFILKFVVPAKTTTYISYYMSELKLTGSPLEEEDSLVGAGSPLVEDSLVGAGLATRTKPSVMDSASLSPAEMVIMDPSPSPMMAAMSGPPMMMPPPPTMSGPPMMMPPPPRMAPSPMMAKGNAPVTMTMVPAPAPVA